MENNYDGCSIRVVALCGSLRRKSFTRMALRIALSGSAELGAATEMLDLRDYELIFCDGKHPDSELPSGVLELRNKIKNAEGVIIGTPEYHGSFSGVLKNALDLMGFDEFEGKLIGLVGVAGGQVGAVNSLNSLRVVGRALHSWVIPEQVSIPTAWKYFNEDGSVNDLRIEDKLKEIGRQVVRFSLLHNSQKFKEFLQMWEVAPENPGGGKL